MLNFNNIHITHGIDELKSWNNKIIPKGEIIITTNNNQIDRLIIGNGEPLTILDNAGKLLDNIPGIKYSTATDISELQASVETLQKLVLDDNNSSTINTLQELLEYLDENDNNQKIDFIGDINSLTRRVETLEEDSNEVLGGYIILGEENENSTPIEIDLSNAFIPIQDSDGTYIDFDRKYLNIFQDAQLSGYIPYINSNGYITFGNTSALGDLVMTSWDAVQQLVRQGQIGEYLKVGDELESQSKLGEDIFRWRIIGINQEKIPVRDNSTEGGFSINTQTGKYQQSSNTNSLTLQLITIPDEFNMAYDSGGGAAIWETSDIRTYLNKSFITEWLDSDLEKVIGPVIKETYDIDNTETEQNYIQTIDYAFCLSCNEVSTFLGQQETASGKGYYDCSVSPPFKITNYGDGWTRNTDVEGKTYQYYYALNELNDGPTTLRQNESNRAWWLRSPNLRNTLQDEYGRFVRNTGGIQNKKTHLSSDMYISPVIVIY